MQTVPAPAAGAPAALDRLTPQQWFEAEPRLRESRPVVIDGVLLDTPAVRTWSPEHLASTHGDARVRASTIEPEAWGDFTKAVVHRMSLAEFVRALQAGHDLQLMQQPLGAIVGLFDQLELTRLAPPPYLSVNLFFGSGTRTPLHFDGFENFLVQVYGTKRFIVEPPSSPAAQYMWDGPAGHICQVDPRRPDITRFPCYDPSFQQHGVLRPGDALYLPPRWFHHLEAPETSISVNVWHGASADPNRTSCTARVPSTSASMVRP